MGFVAEFWREWEWPLADGGPVALIELPKPVFRGGGLVVVLCVGA